MGSSFYTANGPVDCSSEIDLGLLKGKTAIVTGGSSGLGYCYAKAFIGAGAFVVIADLQPPPNSFDELQAIYIKCDMTVWEDQLATFEAALERSPEHKIDVVIANAGIAGPDILAGLNDEKPQKPSTKMIDVNITGVLYTTKLAGWYFNAYLDGPIKGCLILVSSIMGYTDTKSSAIYAVSKFGVRGLMCCLRRKGVFRVNCVAPWFIATPIMRDDFLDSIQHEFQAMGLDLAKTEDATTAVVRIATDHNMNGRTLAIVPRQLSPSGYMDLNLDDFEEGTPQAMLQNAASSISYGKFGHVLS